jgi:probable addiction module antidote protein
MTTDYATFDISDYLDNDEVIAEYLSAAAEDPNPDVLLIAISHVAKARGMGQVANAAGLGRESLYKALSPGSHPRFETVSAVLRALNVHFAVVTNADKAEESEPEYASHGA